MPVYERGYRHWEHSGRQNTRPWLAIARRGISSPLQSRPMLLLLMAAWVPAIVKGGILYFTYKMGDVARLLGGSWTDITAAGFLAYLRWQLPFVLIVLAIVGSGLITRDKEENGLALYFARPLGLFDYVLGKGLVVLFYYFSVTLFPLLLLCFFGYLVTEGSTGTAMLLSIPLRATLFCTVSGTALSLVLLALSSVGTRTVFVALWWVLLFAGTEGLADIMGLFRPWLRIIDFAGQHMNMGVLFLSGTASEDISPWVSMLVVLVQAGLGWMILRKRVRPVEVVS